MADAQISGPFGPADHVLSMPARRVAAMYLLKCDLDVSEHLQGLDDIQLYECAATGYRFWFPYELAGNERFYEAVSKAWKTYYQETRWEYDTACSLLKSGDALLEIGAGRGFFLRRAEELVASASGLELHRGAISEKVCRSEIHPRLLQELPSDARFDVICAFQVLEHVPDPAAFIRACVAHLKPGGRLIFSTPNHEHTTFARFEDAFDLPPHHVGQFTPQIYRRIADHLGLTLLSCATEPQPFALPPASSCTRQARAYRVAGRVTRKVFGRLYGHLHEPGPTVIVSMSQR